MGGEVVAILVIVGLVIIAIAATSGSATRRNGNFSYWSVSYPRCNKVTSSKFYACDNCGAHQVALKAITQHSVTSRFMICQKCQGHNYVTCRSCGTTLQNLIK